MLLFKINRKPYMGSPMAPSDLTLGELKRPKTGSLGCQSFTSRKGDKLRHMLLLYVI